MKDVDRTIRNEIRRIRSMGLTVDKIYIGREELFELGKEMDIVYATTLYGWPFFVVDVDSHLDITVKR